MQVVSCNYETTQKKFDSFEQLFSIYSQEYRKEFNKKLFEKLMAVENESNNDETN